MANSIPSNPKVAIVHEWFDSVAGSEKVVQSFLEVFPDADMFALVDFMTEEDKNKYFKAKPIKTTFIQKVPFAKKKFRSYLPLFPLAIEQLDLRGYDIILSSSHAVAKGVICKADQFHVSYVHSPMRYAWDFYHQYLADAGLKSGIGAWLAKYFLHKIRLWDVSTANRVDRFVANSNYIANRVFHTYRREAQVIYPPVHTERFSPLPVSEKKDYYFTISRFVSYKKIDLIVKAFSLMPEKKLVVAGYGGDEKKIKAMATDNISFVGRLSDAELEKHMQEAKALVFAAEEDFGIVPVEAMAAGTPVIAYQKGGASETVVHGETGILFDEQTEDALILSVNNFEEVFSHYDPTKIAEHASLFSKRRFEDTLKKFVLDSYAEFLDTGR